MNRCVFFSYVALKTGNNREKKNKEKKTKPFWMGKKSWYSILDDDHT